MARLRLLATLIGSCFLFNSPVHCKVNIGDFFPFGVEHGDSTVPPADDTFAGPIALRHPFSFFNNSQSSLFVNNNGAISFAQGVSQYTATCGALPARLSMIAPYWADIHNAQGLGGAVYYRETTDRALLQKAAREIQTGFPNLWGLTIGWLFIATWHEAPFYGASQCYRPNAPNIPRNTFQSILATDGRRSFAIFYYNKITWTTGTASGSGDKCTGLGGQPAKAGFDVGDGRTFYEVEGSCTAAIVNIDDRSNINVDGKFIFQVDNTFESTTCDNEKYKHERLQISPSFVTVFGHVPITLKGPCLNSSTTITCQFNDPAQQPIRVTGMFQSVNNTPTAVCVVPHIYTYGRITVDMIVNYRESVTTYSGFIYVTEPQEQVKVEVEPTDEGEWSVTLNWDPVYFPAPTGSLSLVLLEYGKESKTWIEHIISDDNIENTGTGVITAEPVEVTSFIAFSLRMKLAQSSLTGFYKGAASRLLCSEELLTVDNDAACQAWYDEDDGPPRDVLPCPPLLSQAIQDERFEIDESAGTTLDYFHPGAELSFRQRMPSPSGAGQQCTYKDGHLILGPMGGGTTDAASPTKSIFEHWLRDVVPWCQCCRYSERSTSCRKYYEKRPSNTGINYVPPPTGLGNGDPHITTFDLVTYTFNGVGEFWMIKSNTFSMQARMEQFADSSGRITPASVFTAFVMKDTNVIQVQLSQSNGIDILLDGEMISFDSNNKQHIYRNLHTSTATITLSEDSNKVTVALAGGYSFTFTSVENSLSIRATSSDTNKGTTQGLLGVFDGNANNDLQTPDGTVISPSDSLHDIHYNFGLKWIIKPDESLFTYSNGKGYNDYANPNFEPNFVRPDVSTLPQHILDMCQNSLDCLYDYATTGSISLANQTRQVEHEFNITIEELTQSVQMCPVLEHPANGQMNLSSLFAGAEATFECDENYILAGNPRLTCGNNNQWSSQVPACVELDLPPDYENSVEKEPCQTATGLFPDQLDCHSYYYCSGGIAYPRECPQRFHFSAFLKICTRPEIAKCIKTPTSAPETTTPVPVTFRPETPAPPVRTTPSAIFVCPQSMGLFANPRDCHSFYQCAHGTPYFQPCPANLHFNPRLMVCDWPQNAGCVVV